MNEPRYIAYGHGYSGGYDNIKDAISVVKKNKQGAVYCIIMPIDTINELSAYIKESVNSVMQSIKKVT